MADRPPTVEAETQTVRVAASPRHDALSVLAFLAGPLAWALDLGVSYALEPRVHATGSKLWMHVTTLASIAVVVLGAWAALRVLRRPRDGAAAPARTAERTRFLALGGLAMNGFFLLAILAQSVPKLMLGARQ